MIHIEDGSVTYHGNLLELASDIGVVILGIMSETPEDKRHVAKRVLKRSFNLACEMADELNKNNPDDEADKIWDAALKFNSKKEE